MPQRALRSKIDHPAKQQKVLLISEHIFSLKHSVSLRSRVCCDDDCPVCGHGIWQCAHPCGQSFGIKRVRRVHGRQKILRQMNEGEREMLVRMYVECPQVHMLGKTCSETTQRLNLMSIAQATLMVTHIFNTTALCSCISFSDADKMVFVFTPHRAGVHNQILQTPVGCTPKQGQPNLPYPTFSKGGEKSSAR